MGEQFQLSEALCFGQLPKLLELESPEEKIQFLTAYANTYVKEEIWGEQLVKKLVPFRRFLEVAAQSNGKIINIAHIARDVGVDDKTVQSYFSILEDTLLGFLLEPFHHSFLTECLGQRSSVYAFKGRNVFLIQPIPEGFIRLPMRCLFDITRNNQSSNVNFGGFKCRCQFLF